MSKRTQNKVNKEANQNLKMNWVKMEEQRKKEGKEGSCKTEGPENEGQEEGTREVILLMI